MAWIIGATLLNVVAGGVLVLASYSMMERNIGLGALGGIGAGAAVIYAEATLGEQWFVVSVNEMKLLVLSGAIGAMIGVVVAVLVFEPEL